ncbi:MAG: hypothetical protein U0136_20750 [Bdellovibrionota bacterium]
MTDDYQLFQCKGCGGQARVEPGDDQFYQKMGVPRPVLCVHCREQRRAALVNQLHLFRRTCAHTGKQIVSCYPPESRSTVVDQAYWYTDAVENTSFGRSIDFKRPFFEQFAELQRVVPRPALFTDYARDENSSFTNFAGRNKNCYLIFDSDENWDCYYSYSVNSSRNCLDCYRVGEMELCYEAVDCRRCYQCAYITNSEGCSESLFLNNCISCRHCICCSNLRHKEYHIWNEPVSKEKFEHFVSEMRSFTALEETKAAFEMFCKKFPQKYLRGFQNENVLGNYLTNCRNAFYSFDCRDGWDLRYAFQSFLALKDCMDIDQCGEGELLYECSNLGYSAFNVRFSAMCLNQIADLTYCELCFNGCSNLFGCVGLKKKQYCILNQQYAPDEYASLVSRLIEHMTRTGEWGSHFPPSCSTVPYNLSVAHQFYPLTRADAVSAGYEWRDSDAEERRPATGTLLDMLEQVPDSITKDILTCRCCGRSYKVIAQELAAYRTMGLPPPRECFHCRHQRRHQRRCPRALWPRCCGKCGESIFAAYAPTSEGLVYCDRCYDESCS